MPNDWDAGSGPDPGEQLDVFACDEDDIDESAGLAEEVRCSQMTELPGETWADIFGDAA